MMLPVIHRPVPDTSRHFEVVNFALKTTKDGEHVSHHYCIAGHGVVSARVRLLRLFPELFRRAGICTASIVLETRLILWFQT